MRRSGYGHKLLGVAKAARLPLIAGHDVAGEVEQVAPQAEPSAHNLKEGDKVWGALPPRSSGSYASHCNARAEWLQPMPPSLSYEQAAALPYVTLTALAALHHLQLNEDNSTGKKVLIQGGSGGVGSICIQLLAAWGAQITSLSGPDNLNFCRELGAHRCLDYHQLEAGELQGFDAVLAAFGLEDSQLFHPRLTAAGGSYTTLRHPLLGWSDRYGILPGITAAGSLYMARRLHWARRQRRYRWSLFSTSSERLTMLTDAVAKKQIRPIIQQTYALSEVATAHQLSESGRVRGKLVLTLPD